MLLLGRTKRGVKEAARTVAGHTVLLSGGHWHQQRCAGVCTVFVIIIIIQDDRENLITN